MHRLDRYRRAADLLAHAGSWLAEREAEHNLILGITGELARRPDEDAADAAADERPYLATVRDGGRLVAVAIRTPPANLLLSEIDDPAALGVIADDLADEELPGVTGPPAATEEFGRRWLASHEGRRRVLLDERIYRLDRVVAPPPATGSPRRAAGADRDLLLAWLLDFHAEALPEEGGDRVRLQFANWDPETGRRFWIWEDGGEPVCLVGAGGPTPSGIRIGPVYTPAQHRRRGYASTLTAFVSQRMLDEGRRFCFLYTDLANPTSNRIYAAIGYEPVTDARMIRFEPA